MRVQAGQLEAGASRAAPHCSALLGGGGAVQHHVRCSSCSVTSKLVHRDLDKRLGISSESPLLNGRLSRVLKIVRRLQR